MQPRQWQHISHDTCPGPPSSSDGHSRCSQGNAMGLPVRLHRFFFYFPRFFPLLYACLEPLIPGHSFVPPQILDGTPRAALCANPACPTRHLLVTLTALRKQTRYSAEPRPRPVACLTLQVGKPRTVKTGYHLWWCLLNPCVCILLLAFLLPLGVRDKGGFERGGVDGGLRTGRWPLHSSLALPHLDFGFRFVVRGSRTSANLNPDVLSVWFGFREALNLNRTERTIREGSGSGSGIFPNWTVGPVQGSGKFTPEPDQTEPQQP